MEGRRALDEIIQQVNSDTMHHLQWRESSDDGRAKFNEDCVDATIRTAQIIFIKKTAKFQDKAETADDSINAKMKH